MPSSWDVAIVGCGPVGAFAAHLLGKAGLRTLVLERDAAPYSLPRAVHFDHEMLRLLAHIGVLAPLGDRLLATNGHLHIGADGGVIRHLSAAGKPRPFGYANDYFFYQPELEAELRSGLARFAHVTLRLGADVVALEPNESGVRLVLSDGSRHAARWVIGADGARSTVRKQLGITLDDLAFDEPWLVVDAEVDGPITFPALSGLADDTDLQKLSVMMCDPARPTTVVPGRGTHRRWEFMLLPGEDDREMADPVRVSALLAPWVGQARHTIIRAATYRFHGLVAHEWMRQRCFLMGDAAHQTPPFFGQGMCHGLRDAANLAWKLALVQSGVAAPSLLDTYQPERDPHVRRVIEKAIEAGRYICLLDPAEAAARDARVRARRDVETAADLIGPIASSIVVHGRGERFINPIVNGGPGLFDDLSGGGWVLVSNQAVELSENAEEILRHLACRRVIVGPELADTENHLTKWFDSRCVNAVLVRPDFYVAAARASGSDLSADIERMAVAMGMADARTPVNGLLDSQKP